MSMTLPFTFRLYVRSFFILVGKDVRPLSIVSHAFRGLYVPPFEEESVEFVFSAMRFAIFCWSSFQLLI